MEEEFQTLLQEEMNAKALFENPEFKENEMKFQVIFFFLNQFFTNFFI